MAQKGSTKKEGVEKIAKAIVGFVSKELLWFFIVFIMALPLGFLMVYVFYEFTSEDIRNEFKEIINGVPFFIVAYIYSAVGIYFTRTVVGSISAIAKKQ